MDAAIDITKLSTLYLEHYLLVLTRVAAVMMTMPVLSSRSVPAIAKISLAAFISFILLPVQSQLRPLSSDPIVLLLLLAQELLCGLLIGFVATALFAGIQMAGQIVGFQMGLNMASSFDPIGANGQSSVMDQFYSLLTGMVFLVLNGHHLMIIGLARSFDTLPIGAFVVSSTLATNLVEFTAQLFDIAIQISIPIATSLILVDVGFLILSKVAPQMNVFSTSQPLKIALGFLILILVMPATLAIIARGIEWLPMTINTLLAQAR